MKKYYDKIKKGMVFEPSDVTIEWEQLPQDFLDYANNLQDKSYEVSYDEDGMPVVKRLQLDEDGNRYSHYLEDGSPDFEAIEQAKAEEEARVAYEEAKRAKLEALGSVIVTVNGVDYDAHETAINNMSSVVGVAHTKYNQLVASGMSPTDAYNSIYKSTIEWKGADNLPHQVQIESVVEALEQAMQKRAEIYGV